MELKDLNSLASAYRSDERCDQLTAGLSPPKARVQLTGLVGSSLSFIAAAAVDNLRGLHLFVLNEKEEAAYLLNDLETILGIDEKSQTHAAYFFPAPARSPYDPEGHHDGERVTRTEVLEELMRLNAAGPPSISSATIIVTYADAVAPLVVGREKMQRHSLSVKRKDHLPVDTLLEWFEGMGFAQVEFVYEPGQFSLRGGIVDVFSYGSDRPFRFELYGDVVESVRRFDPQDQLSVERLSEAVIIPDLQDEDAASQQSFFEQLPLGAVVWMRSPTAIRDAATRSLEQLRHAYGSLTDAETHSVPEELVAAADELIGSIEPFKTVLLDGHQDSTFSAHATSIHFGTKPQPAFGKDFKRLSEDLHAHRDKGFSPIIACSNAKQVTRLYTIFEDMEHEVCFTPLLLKLHEGFIDPSLKLVCYTDHQIFERYQRFRLKEGFQRNSQALTLKELTQLKPGDLVVHVDHGIGVFGGLQKIEVEPGSNGAAKLQEAIRIHYRDDDILYVSIHSLHRVSKYSGKEGVQPKVNKLGSSAWKNLKERTKKKVKELAFDLIKLYAKRKAQEGHAFPPDNYLQHELEASFIYEDTPDQEKATADVKRDMEQPTPMDRLVCGDVGFGKTEVAIRAAFKAVCESKQVAVMVPTTILSMQHHKTFDERLQGLPCRVDHINRFRSRKEITQILKDLKEGKIDILIGTHRLVSKDVVWKDLGLLILDEEQKFGVGVKDKLKTLRASVDTLTLTATPIPRTLQFSLMGARDLSIISTPPPNRYPVQTIVRPFNEEVIRKAIEAEVARGGQVFLVNDRVQNIEEVAGMVRRMCPGVRVVTGHGQMDGKHLEKIMLQFIEGDQDVLIATTIIESGLDIPNANTMIINEAHKFGLSDLHQLRGRVGRSNKKAYCYLLAPEMHVLSSDARRRLQAIEQFSDLGSGLHIAMKDLDIRGAGDLLGAEQSGFINDIGMETYHRILDEAVQELKEKEFKELFKDDPKAQVLTARDCQIDTDLSLLIPQDYVHDIAERLSLYRELDELKSDAEIDTYRAQLEDRFGPVPMQTEDLLRTMHLRLLAQGLGIEKLVLKHGKLVAHFIADPEAAFYSSPTFHQMVEFIKQAPAGYKMFEKSGTLRMSIKDVGTVDAALDVLMRLVQVEA